jgi:hypothetical protein
VVRLFNQQHCVDVDGTEGRPMSFCSKCKQECSSVERDFGYGSYDYFGAKGCHTHWEWVSECCEEEILEELDEDDTI